MQPCTSHPETVTAGVEAGANWFGEQAAWPVLVVDQVGHVLRANRAARRLFAPEPDASVPPLGTLWGAANALPATQWLARAEAGPALAGPVQLTDVTGRALRFRVAVCPRVIAGRSEFWLQLFAEPAESPPAANGSVLLKQKLECALQLARTVALDFNNALTSILGHTSLVLSRMPPDHPWRASLLEVEKSAARAAEAVHDLATFSRPEKESRSPEAGNINSLVHRTVETFKAAHPTGILWAVRLERQPFAVRFEEAKLQQALIKILENAVQALERDGRIGVTTRNVELTAPTQDRAAQLPAGCYVCIEVTDNGSGIEPDVLPRIFEPFFTTKRSPHRGLGLALVYGIVTNHGGNVAVSSQPGAGTSVRVYLPAERRILAEDAVALTDLQGDQTILLVDDEELLLTMGQTILSSFGYRVLTANSGSRALEILTSGQPPVDLLLTDLVMPGMSGRELVEAARRVSPTTRVLCCSGYVVPGGRGANELFLQKPFTTQELLIKVKRALRGVESPAT